MKLTKVVKSAIKWGPIILPVVMKFMNDKKEQNRPAGRRR
ncbi:hypothetical protein QWT68_00990 [Sporosarcina trichiuri]|nr:MULTISPECIES: hypothetical protein [Sporosarcina]WJY27624.1 hypothetical protein QWT68_00990 [Sporosarcina sp. 0.2-SM1T-5]